MVMRIAAVTRQRLHVAKPIPGYLLQPTALDISRSLWFRLEFSTRISGYIVGREQLTSAIPHSGEREEVRTNRGYSIQKGIFVLVPQTQQQTDKDTIRTLISYFKERDFLPSFD